MSHIVSYSNVSEKKLFDYLEMIRTNGYNENVLCEILNGIIPVNGNYQVSGVIQKEGYPAYFNFFDKEIHLSEVDLKKYVDNMLKSIISVYPGLEKYKTELFSYLILFVLCHEVEHVYQFLFASDYLDHPVELVSELYKNIVKFPKGEFKSKIIEFILFERYKAVKDKATFVLERNANIEAYDLLYKLSLNDDIFDIERFLHNQYLWYSACGYLKLRNNGAFEESYKDIWRYGLFKSFDFSEEISVEDRIRYGLPIEDDDRISLLKKFVGTKENIK